MKRDDRTHWRSFAELAGDPEFLGFAEREFPEGASELPAGISRRRMLMLLGASLSLAGATGCRRPVERIVPWVSAPEDSFPGIPLHYATAMPFGRGAFGLVVESHDGRPTKVEGNPDHPATRGATSPWMQASILELYDPDRSRTPRLLGEPSGWGEFEAAWKEIETGLLERGGRGLAVLTEPACSPTSARLEAAVRARFPGVRWVAWEPLGDENVLLGLRAATGAAVRPVHHLERAERILALDADFLHTDPEMARHGRGFARGRRAGAGGGAMNRLYAVEGAYTVTGANADHRLRLRPGAVPTFVGALAAELARLGLAVPAPAGAAAPDGADPRWIEVVATDLLEHRGRGLLLAGPAQPPAVHAAVAALNHALGNGGSTVTYHPLRDTTVSTTAELGALVESMHGGEVSTLVVLGGNPLYDAPADLDFAGALSKVERTIRLGLHRDETSLASTWHLPRAHWLEAWGDARAADGTPSVIQPLILPLFDGRSDVELLGLLATGAPASGHDLVRETWRGLLGEDGFEARWNRTLHDGLLAEGALPPVPVTVDASVVGSVEGAATPASGGLELVLRGSPAVHDGRFANNGWLQELPETMTKLTWDNAALLAPATAARLGVRNEDVVRLELDGRHVELPAWIVPGQADDTVVVWLGYGRRAAGRLGNGVGADAYALRSSTRAWHAGGLTVTPTGGRHELASTQDHGAMQGRSEPRPRPIVREAPLERYREHPTFAKEAVELPPLEQMIPDHDYSQGPQWGMSIDLNVCTGCNACVVACQSENNVPVVGRDQVRRGREMHWLRVDRYFVSRGRRAEQDPSPRAVVQPVPCMHCENAPCEQVCPVAATVHDSEGLNVMVYNRCIGTRYCSNNCPYKVRRFNFYDFTKDTPEILKLAQNPEVTVRSRGVMEKCTYCTQRIAAAKRRARLEERPLRDGDVRTACQQACPTGAIVFGDVNDPASRVSLLKQEPRDYALLAELNNRPRTTFLAKLTNPHPRLASTAPTAPAEGEA